MGGRFWQRLKNLIKDDEEIFEPRRRDPRVVARVLMVCMGNICRSPTAEAVFMHRAARAGLAPYLEIDSCGTHAGHSGEPPDRRSQQAAAQRGYSMEGLRARRLEVEDLDYFDYILVMDEDNLQRVLSRCSRPEQKAKVRLLLDFAPELGEREVPDPYYGGRSGFDRVLNLIEAGTDGLIAVIRERHGL
ncbi:protein tyrosine phosphatase [Plasticicumulans acidivorans]|uniref:protein-tyrosine-phosphatase n=2 Tax=Plasticicumulans acidivorans TaxID=886464 RepID=A0A317MRK6_9GAMM|nr:protein tyrosine phosphatase [Plasticicumulans acidivorans]